MKLLKVEGLNKVKDNSQVLDHIHLEVKKGQVCGIISDNRDKLNLFIDIISGLDKEDEGEILYFSNPLSYRERIKMVGVVRENFHLVDKTSVLDNIFLGITKKYSRFGLINTKALKTKAHEIQKLMGININLNVKVRDLNSNEKLMVEIARVLAMDCGFYIFGPVTRSMSLRQFDAFGTILRNLKNEGKGIILVPVTAEDITKFVDRLYFLKGSQLMEIENCHELGADKLNELLLTPEKSQMNQVYEPIYKAKDIIENSLHLNDLDIQHLADSVFMGYENFRRRFKMEVGISPNQYFLKVKMNRAKEMLLYTNLGIKEIAEKLGFSDPYYFSRLFKEREKMSPAKFRAGRLDISAKNRID